MHEAITLCAYVFMAVATGLAGSPATLMEVEHTNLLKKRKMFLDLVASRCPTLAISSQDYTRIDLWKN